MIPISVQGQAGTFLKFESQGLDLDTGKVFDERASGPLFLENPEVDIKIAYNTDFIPHGVVLQNRLAGVEIAFVLPGTNPLEAIDKLASDVIDKPFDKDTQILISTPPVKGVRKLYLLAFPEEKETGVSFQFQNVGEVSGAGVPIIGGPASSNSPSGSGSAPGSSYRSEASTPSGINSSEWQTILAQITELEGSNNGFSTGNLKLMIGSAALGILLIGLVGIARQSAFRLGKFQVRHIALSAPLAALIVAIPLVISISGVAYATHFSETQKLTASDGALDDEFGFSVDIDGDTLIVGSRFGDAGATLDSGAAYVFTLSGSSWSLEQKLEADDAGFLDEFGSSVAIYEDTAIVGAPLEDTNGTDAGSAYVFTRSGTVWTEQLKLETVAAAANAVGSADEFGISVDMDGNTAVVGARTHISFPSFEFGAAYVFTGSGSSWSQQEILTSGAPFVFGLFGIAVSISNDNLIIGEPAPPGTSGRAFVSSRTGTTWSTPTALSASAGSSGDVIGLSVSMDGDKALVGSPFDDLGSGSVYAYSFDGTSSMWVEDQKIIPAGLAPGDVFGISVDISGNTAIVGAAASGSGLGSAYVLTYDDTAALLWDVHEIVTASDIAAGDQFGIDVAIDAAGGCGTQVIGANLDDDGSPNSGSAYILGGGELTVAAALVPIGGSYDDDDFDDDDDAGTFRVEFSVESCDSNTSVTAELIVQGLYGSIPVSFGDIIEFEHEDDDAEVEFEDGILEIEAPGLTLRVTATDASGNTAVAEFQVVGLGDDDDDDHDHDHD